MKTLYIGIITFFTFHCLLPSAVPSETAFEDKPALTRGKWWSKKAGQTLATVGGMAAVHNKYLDYLDYNEETIRDLNKKFDAMKLEDVPKLENRILEIREYFHNRPYLADAIIWAPAVTAAGAGGYKLAGAASDYALSRKHGISYRLEKVSQHYNINAAQYAPILSAAERKDIPALQSAIAFIFPQRFGPNWQLRMLSLFNEFQPKSSALLKKRTSNLSQDESDFIRMCELGAAMSTLLENTKNVQEKNG